MDRRSWPWKKKSSDKSGLEKAFVASESADPAASPADKLKQESYKKPNYVQISVESYSHLTGLEDKVKSYEDEVKTYEDQIKSLEDEVEELNEKLSAAQTEIAAKETLVKQHTKVAEEAVSGWEKAEAEAAALKNHLESVTLQKLSADDRAAHLDGALKECMRQIRNLKEEHEQNIHEVILTKTKQFDRMKLEFEAKIGNLDREIRSSYAENEALSRSLQERSNMLMRISEEKSRAESEIELLKGNIESCERDISSLKYEVHVVTKQLEIRNEENAMSVRSAEVANKQHSEGLKKITKLEAECQRLRGLVRKKLPGPAAVAQMKLEVENLGRDYGETRLRRSPGRPPSPHFPSLPEFSLDSVQKHQKETEMLTQRLLENEEELKMLKEALAKRNSELQASRSVCAKTISRLQIVEAQLKTDTHLKSNTISGAPIPVEASFSQSASNAPSLASMSEAGNDDEVSSAGSWANALISELSHFKKEKKIDSPKRSESASNLELMDDFLEMEKLANSSNDTNGVIPSPNNSVNVQSETAHHDELAVTTETDIQPSEQPQLDPLTNQNVESDGDLDPLMKLQSRVSFLLKSLPKDSDLEKVFTEISSVVECIHCGSTQQGQGSVVEETLFPNAAELVVEKEISSSPDGQHSTGGNHKDQELSDAVSSIHNFVLLLGKEVKSVQVKYAEGSDLCQKFEEFSAAFDEVADCESLKKFVIRLSPVLSEGSKCCFRDTGYDKDDAEISSPDCIDKIALPESKEVQGPSGGRYPNGFPDSTSDSDIPHEGSFVPTSESNVSSWKCSPEEFDQLKLEKENSVTELARCTEHLESTKSQLQETEQLLAEIKSQLASAQKVNVLAETQLKCMAESYNSLEVRADDLQTQVNLLQSKIETLENELQEEKRNHQQSDLRCKDLQEQLQRIEICPAADADAKTNQETDLAAAAEKLAECQETIFLLGKQLKGMRPQPEFMGSPYHERVQKVVVPTEEEPTTTAGRNSHEMEQVEMGLGGESPLNIYNALYSPESEGNNLLQSPISSVNSKHRPTRSGSSSSSSNPTPEKNARGFSRFFSTKAKTGN